VLLHQEEVKQIELGGDYKMKEMGLKKIIPALGKLVIKGVSEAKITKSGIVLAKSGKETKETPQIVELVVASNETMGYLSDNFDITESEFDDYNLAIPKYSGVSIEIGKVDYKVVEVDDVLALVAKEGTDE